MRHPRRRTRAARLSVERPQRAIPHHQGAAVWAYVLRTSSFTGVFFLLAAYYPGTSAHAVDGLEIDIVTTLEDALANREDDRIKVLFEVSLNSIPAVSERLARLRQELDKNRRNNSICLSSGPAMFGKSASTCNSYDHDLLFLQRRDGQSITESLSYYTDFVEEPLLSGLAMAIDALKKTETDWSADPCTRIVFRDAASGQLRSDIPTIVMIDSSQLLDQDPGVEKLLRRCLD